MTKRIHNISNTKENEKWAEDNIEKFNKRI